MFRLAQHEQKQVDVDKLCRRSLCAQSKGERQEKHGGAMAKQLNPGDSFPNYTVPTTDGRTLNIPNDLKGEYAVIIFYRGIW